jgi:putative hemolysin
MKKGKLYMKVKMIIIGIAILIGLLVVSAWGIKNRQPDPATATPASSIANPASVNCEQKGGKLEIRTTAGGDQYGVCTFLDGSECEEWAFLRGECVPVTSTPSH